MLELERVLGSWGVAVKVYMLPCGSLDSICHLVVLSQRLDNKAEKKRGFFYALLSMEGASLRLNQQLDTIATERNLFYAEAPLCTLARCTTIDVTTRQPLTQSSHV